MQNHARESKIKKTKILLENLSLKTKLKKNNYTIHCKINIINDMENLLKKNNLTHLTHVHKNYNQGTTAF